MKIKPIITGLLLAAGLSTGYLFVPKAAGDPPQQSCEVISFGYEDYTGRNQNGVYVQLGTRISWVNRTQGAPDIIVGMRVVDAIQILRNARYEKEPDINYGQHTFFIR